MTSKYDAFWAEQLPLIDEAVGAAASGSPVVLTLSGIRELGDRASWYGAATVRGQEVGEASMAHVLALARAVAKAEICLPWPHETLRFTVSADGSRLTVAQAAWAGGRASGRTAAVRSQASRSRAAHPGVVPDAPVASDVQVDPDLACGEIHRLMERLPSYTDPGNVPFLNGLYFFYEDGEVSAHGPAGRIVRIGNHPRAAEGLVRRLRGHYRSGTGAKNGSVFRRYLGGAILRSRDPISPCLSPGPGAGHWERQDADACHDCRSLEEAVSQLLRSRFRFRCVRIDDPDERNRFEARLIASVAACTVCQPSAVWLGRHAYPQVVQRSGLWNSQYVGGNTADADDPFSFRRLVAASGPSGASGSSLSDTMLIIPCSSAKAGAEDPGLPVVRIGDLLGPVAAATLEEERKIALERRGTSLDLHSPLRPALAWYTGQPYATPGVRERLVAAINRGVHCLIISGGYGVLRAEEPIHSYGAHLPTQTRSVWARRVPVILQDYVTRNGIRRAITVVSGGYASVLPGALCEEDARYVPTFSRGADSGAALRVVPERVGALVAEVLADL